MINGLSPASLLARCAAFARALAQRIPPISPPLTGVCKNEIIATNRPATPGFPPTSE